jgi:ssDNA-binding Zn-finger/Zn-ribbon topoisomerase 1
VEAMRYFIFLLVIFAGCSDRPECRHEWKDVTLNPTTVECIDWKAMMLKRVDDWNKTAGSLHIRLFTYPKDCEEFKEYLIKKGYKNVRCIFDDKELGACEVRRNPK